MNTICVGGPWDREQLYLSDCHSTAVLEIPQRSLRCPWEVKIYRGRYVRKGDSVVSIDCGVSMHIAVYWEPK